MNLCDIGCQECDRCRAWVLLQCRTAACDPHALGGDQCGEQRGPDFKHSTTTTPREERRTSMGREEQPEWKEQEVMVNGMENI